MAAPQWNFADVWEHLADRFPEAPALVHGDVVRSWREFSKRSDGLAATLLASGLGRQDKVAQYCRNRPEYLESLFACFKASFVPVNTNFRYGDEELVYLWKDADVTAVVFDAEFTGTCERLRAQVPGIRSWIRVPGGPEDDDCPPWAVPYGEAADSSPVRVRAVWGRSGEDLNLLYTGGTTGMPKGVMWQQHDFFLMLEKQYGRMPPEQADVEGYLSRCSRPGPRVLPGPPLMHGTACWFAMAALSAAGSVVTLTSTHFDPVELLETVSGRDVKGLCIVGDPFAKPILSELDSQPGRYDLHSLRLIMSSGAMLSRESKERLLRHAPHARVVDGLGSSESGSVGSAVAEQPGEAATARFRLGDHVRVLDDDNRDVLPGSGRAGRLAVSGHLPVGYYKDPDKTAATFLTIDGRRFVVAGDWATVELDGSITLLGRGSGCINTAGEKVFPEEVEEVLKRHPSVRDASVVGVPDERFGEAVIALVEPEEGAHVDEEALVAHAKAHLAGYKAPKRVLEIAQVARHANGKMDYRLMAQVARSELEHR